MINIYNFQRFKIILLIVLSAALFFIIGLWIILSHQSKSIFEKKLLSSIKNAETLSTTDLSISFERALKIYSNNLTFSVFTAVCDPLYIKDLKITSKTCLKNESTYVWIRTTDYMGRLMIIGSRNDQKTLRLLLEYKEVVLMTSITYFIFILFLTFYLFNMFLDKPLERISHTIKDIVLNKNFENVLFKSDSHTYLSDFYKSLSLLISQVELLTREQTRHVLAKQILHDLQAPLYVLENEAALDNSLSPVIKVALRRLKDISSSLLSRKDCNTKGIVNLRILLNELQQMYQSIKFDMSPPDCSGIYNLSIDETQLFRFLCNIIKNSIESGSTQISVQVFSNPTSLSLTLTDNGRGLDPNIIPQILSGYTTKPTGNGLGISSIHSTLQELNGKVEIKPITSGGLEISLLIPFAKTSEYNYVLIDDDKLIRASWKSIASKKKVNLKCFESIDEFVENIPLIANNSHIYVDSQLKGGVIGEIEAFKIFQNGFTEIFLATGFYPDKFDLKLTPWIKKVVTKTVPF